MSELSGNYALSLAGRIPGGRLTLTSGTPVTTSDVTGATSVYYTPYVHDVIRLWTGTAWYPVQFSETTLALGTLTSAKPYDIFGYLSSGSLSLESLVWTNDTTRATAVTIQDGRYCKSGDKTRLYLGTFYTSSTTTTEDSTTKRLLFNAYGRVARPMSVKESTANWAYSGGVYRQARNSSANQLEYMDGLGVVNLDVRVFAVADANQIEVASGVGIDSTSVNSAQTYGVEGFPFREVISIASYVGIPGAGRRRAVWLEYSTVAADPFWYGTDGVSTYVQSAIGGILNGM